METTYDQWLHRHFKEAQTHYAKLCKLDDKQLKDGGSSEYYEQAHQMFGYLAASRHA